MQDGLRETRNAESDGLRGFGLNGLDDDAEVLVIGRLQGDEAAVGAAGVRLEEARSAIDIALAGFGELGGMGHRPD